MPAPATVDEFLELVRKSGVVEEARLKSYIQEKNVLSDTPTEVNKYAGLMVRDGLLTYFQAEQFLQGKWSASPSANTRFWNDSVRAAWVRSFCANTS